MELTLLSSRLRSPQCAGQESRAAVSSIHSTLAGNWTAVSNQSAAIGPLASAARAWIGDYEGPVLRAVESAGPAVSTWLETRLDAIAEANNLTEVRPCIKSLTLRGIGFTQCAG
jgi:hypothetical protein